MSRTDNPEALGLEQRCVRPGHWVIEGFVVKATYQGRSSKVLRWYITDGPDDVTVPVGGFFNLADVREWVKDNR